MAKIDEIEGIGAAYAEKLEAAGISTTEELLALCCDAAGRDKVAGTTGVSTGQLLKWANMADLMRISGIGKQYSELLEAAGVDTVKELATRNHDNLTQALEKINAEKNLARATPAASVVEDWVAQAKKMPAKITH